MANDKINQMVADRILAELQKGIIPWHKPWGIGDNYAVSHVDGRVYSLLNQILIGEPGEYATFKQISEAGGKVKKGAKGRPVVFWNPVKKKEIDSETGEEKEKIYFVLKYYNVFNLNDTEGVEFKFYGTPEMHEIEGNADAEEIVGLYQSRNSGLKIERDRISNEAFYSPSFDTVKVPMKEQFESTGEFFSTLFHELVHSTGHKTRLNRFKGAKSMAFGSEVYSAEELTAEVGSAMLINRCGLESEFTFENSVAYIQGWMKHIKSDPACVVSAIGRAEKAVDYILNGAVSKEEE